jgi:hypothetical protein
MVKDHRPSLSHAKNHISSSQVENKKQETNAGESHAHLMVVASTPLPGTGVVLRPIVGC